ncbi:MAG TPA: 3-isopropylmalate dehydratase [bacterium]|nr:3-isopropylmalate dehydratase [bacterium]
MAIITGKAFVYGDNVNTDVIFPGKYTYSVTDPKEIAAHTMEDEDPAFVKEMKPGDILVAGKNFGCGSSREQAAFCFKYLGLGAIVAESYSRIYYRNCINAGLLAVEVKGLAGKVKRGDTVTIDTDKGTVKFPDGSQATFAPLPPEIEGIMKAGGLDEFIAEKLKKMNG